MPPGNPLPALKLPPLSALRLEVAARHVRCFSGAPDEPARPRADGPLPPGRLAGVRRAALRAAGGVRPVAVPDGEQARPAGGGRAGVGVGARGRLAVEL